MSQTKAQLIDPVDGTIVNADINASAAIAGTKISPDFGSQNIATTGETTTSDIFLGDSILHTGDTNTKIRFPAADTVSVETAGTERIRVASNGDIGIGTTTLNRADAGRPLVQFDYSGSDGSEGLELRLSNSAINGNAATDNAAITYIGQTLGITNRENGTIQFRNNGSERLRIDASGRLMIGTTTVGYSGGDDLTINTSGDTGLTIRSGTSNQGTIAFADGTSGSDQYRGFIQYFHNGDLIMFGTSAANRIKIDSSGHFVPNDDSTYNIGSNSVRFANGYFDTLYGDASNLTGLSSDSISEGNSTAEVLDTGSNGIFRFSAEGSEVFRIATDGKVGMGTNNPSEQLSITNSSSTGSQMQFRDNSTGTASSDGFRVGYNGDGGQLWNFENNYVRIATNNTERLRVTNSGRVGINTTAPDHLFEVADNNSSIATSRTGANAQLLFKSNSVAQAGQIQVSESSGGGIMLFYTKTTSGTVRESFRIDTNGAIATNGAGVSNGAVFNVAKDGTHITCRSFATGGYDSIFFRSANTNVGKIHFNSGGTQYHTSSDYRRKENIVNLTGAIDRVKLLQPKRFNFITDSSTTLDGFLAHEVTPAVPEAILGTKDQVANAKDVEEGRADEIGDPIYQTIDQSTLIPLLTAAIKELTSRVETLEAA